MPSTSEVVRLYRAIPSNALNQLDPVFRNYISSGVAAVAACSGDEEHITTFTRVCPDVSFSSRGRAQFMWALLGILVIVMFLGAVLQLIMLAIVHGPIQLHERINEQLVRVLARYDTTPAGSTKDELRKAIAKDMSMSQMLTPKKAA